MLNVLSGRLPRSSISELNVRIWEIYKVRVAEVDRQPTLGATVMTRLSLLTLVMFEQLSSHNLSDQEAIRTTSSILWIIYEKITNRFWVLTRVFSRTPIKRVGKAMDFFIKCFPYRSPGYEMQILNADHTEYAFNVYKCPAAEFFIKHNRGDLCVASWCNLDYPLADKWKVTLERERTIAKGDPFCNFRFIAIDLPPNHAIQSDGDSATLHSRR